VSSTPEEKLPGQVVAVSIVLPSPPRKSPPVSRMEVVYTGESSGVIAGIKRSQRPHLLSSINQDKGGVSSLPGVGQSYELKNRRTRSKRLKSRSLLMVDVKSTDSRQSPPR